MRDIVLALFIFGTIPFILARPYVGLLVWSWIGYMNPHRLTYGFAYGFPWVMLIAVVTLVSLVISKESKRIRATPTALLMLFFFLWTTLSTVFAYQQPSAWHQWDQFGKSLVMVAVTLMLVKDRHRMHWLVWLIVVSIGFYGVKGGAFTLMRGGAYHVLGPPDSFISGNNDLAQALCMVLPLMRYLQLQASNHRVRLGLGLAMLLTGVAILGTYSRGGMIALAVVAAVLFLKSRGRITVALTIFVLGFTAYHFMPEQWLARMHTISHASTVKTAETRIQSWEFAANVAIHHPAIGGGFNVYENPQVWNTYAPEGAKERAVHSIYFRVLGEQGFPGIALFVMLLFASWRSCARVRRSAGGREQDRWAFDLASMLQVSLLAFMTAGLATTSSYFDLSFQIMAMCALLGVMVTEGESDATVAGRASSMRASGSTTPGTASLAAHRE